MILSFLIRFGVFALLWLVLSGDRMDEPLLAVSVVVVATLASIWLWRPGRTRVNVLPLIAFVPYFLRQSVLGGWDVAKRALKPSLPVHPGFVEIELALESEAARICMAWTVSLLPGTASAELTAGRLMVHVLDDRAPNLRRLRDLETRIGRIFRG